MSVHIDPDVHDTPSAAHILTSAFPPSPSGNSANSAPFPPPPPPFMVFHHALVCKRWLRLARFSLPAILLQADRRLSTLTFRSVISSPPRSSSSPPTSAVSPSFPLRSPLTLRHLHIGPSALDATTDDLLYSIAMGCAPSLTHMSLYRHRNLRSWDRDRGFDDPDEAVAEVTEPAVTALFAACRRLVSLKLVLPVCLPELPASVSLLQQLTRLEVSCGRVDFDFAGAFTEADAAPEPQGELPESVGSLSALRSLCIRAPCVRALPHTLSRLHSLTSLKIDHCVTLRHLPGGLGQLKKLQHLKLEGLHALISLADSIGLLSSLETLHLRSVVATTLPDSAAHLSSLKRFLLSSLPRLQSLPDYVGELPSLQELSIQQCSRLTSLPRSASSLASLTAFTVQNCRSLASLPEDIGDAPRLASLVLDELPSLVAIPESVALLSSLTHLRAAKCEVLMSLPASFDGLHSLSQLQLLGCALESLPEDFGQLSALTELHLSEVDCDLPESFGQLLKLRRLTVAASESELTLPTTFTQLEDLVIRSCYNLDTLPETIGQLTALRTPSSPHPLPSLHRLLILKCPSLASLPSGLHLLPSLLHLEIRDCVKFTKLAPRTSPSPFPPTLQTLILSNTLQNTRDMQQAISHLSSLQHLRIEHSSTLKTVPIASSLESLSLFDLSLISTLSTPNIHTLQKLKILTLHTLSLLSPLPPSITALTHLQRLHLSHMEFSNLPEDLGQMQGLRVLTIKTAPKLLALPASLTLLTSLQHLMVSECKKLPSLPEDGFGNLSSLVSLKLNNLPLLLKLPAAVAHLPLLQVLDVQECEELCELPEGLESARSLREVYVDGCSQLEEELPEALLARSGRIQVHAEDYYVD
ncbi:unnamed protein product [Closterium sp. NIES-64]|nr:unnamed protein product [Closterium sp. NIES-64]